MLSFQQIKSNTHVVIPAGVHYLSEPVVIRGKNIRITGEDGAVIRGTVRLGREDFVEIEPGIWSAKVPARADAFYVGERKYSMARYPKADWPDEVYAGYAADCIFPSKTKEWADPAGGYIHAMHLHHWGGYTYRIDGKNEDGTLKLSGGWQNNRQMGMHDEYRYAENIREEMTRPGEWYFDERQMRIYIRPVDGDDLDLAEVAVARGFFILEDCDNVTIENITFERSIRTFMDTKEPLLRSDWTIYRGGALLVKGSVNCCVDRCAFLDIGSNGLFVDGNNENIRISRSHFKDIGASGLCFVGWPDAVRSPLFEYNETQRLGDIYLTPGPKSCNYPKNCAVEDCLIEYVGMMEKQATGVEEVFASTDFAEVTRGDNGCFNYYMTYSNKSIYQLNPAGSYAKLLVPSLYGGYRLWASEFAGDRTRLARVQDLQIGDVLLGKTSSSEVVMLYLGEDIGFINMGTLAADTVSTAARLERLLAYGNYYAIMRPMQSQQ